MGHPMPKGPGSISSRGNFFRLITHAHPHTHALGEKMAVAKSSQPHWNDTRNMKQYSFFCPQVPLPDDQNGLGSSKKRVNKFIRVSAHPIYKVLNLFRNIYSESSKTAPDVRTQWEYSGINLVLYTNCLSIYSMTVENEPETPDAASAWFALTYL